MKLRTKFGAFGGIYIPEMMVAAMEDVEKAFIRCRKDRNFNNKLSGLLRDYAGRPSPLYLAENFSRDIGCKVYFKREDLLHTGAHKINNTLGQAMLAKQMGKKEIIAETGAGQHGVATAVVCALFGLSLKVFMGAKDIERQKPNVYRMQLCGAEVVPVTAGSQTLKDAVNAALRYFLGRVDTCYYVLGSVVGPHPYPMMVQHFQKVIGNEARRQILAREGRLPTHVIACVGGGSNAIGIFDAFLRDKVRLIGVEAGGNGKKHGKTLSQGEVGIFQGSKSYVLQNKDGQIEEAHSISAGLDYPGVGPVHSFLKESKRAMYTSATDKEALHAFHYLSRKEGIFPALESLHAIAFVLRNRKMFSSNDILLISLSGRGDKDINQVLSFGK